MVRILVNKKMVGQVTDGYFFKTLKSSRHFLRKPPAIAFDVESIDQAKEHDAHTVLIKDIDNNLYYKAPIDKIKEMGFDVNRGHGEQVALGLEHWSRDCIVCFAKDYVIKGLDCGCPSED